MEYEGLSPHLQVFAVYPYPEPDKSSPHPAYTVSKDTFKSEALWSYVSGGRPPLFGCPQLLI